MTRVGSVMSESLGLACQFGPRPRRDLVMSQRSWQKYVNRHRSCHSTRRLWTRKAVLEQIAAESHLTVMRGPVAPETRKPGFRCGQKAWGMPFFASAAESMGNAAYLSLPQQLVCTHLPQQSCQSRATSQRPPRQTGSRHAGTERSLRFQHSRTARMPLIAVCSWTCPEPTIVEPMPASRKERPDIDQHTLNKCADAWACWLPAALVRSQTES